MKKIILSSIVLLTLTSCGTVTKEDISPDKMLNQNQSSLIEKLEDSINYTPKQWVSEWAVQFGVESKEWTLNWEINYGLNFAKSWQEFDWEIKIELNAKIEDKTLSPIEKIGWALSLSLLQKEANKVFFKLNKLTVDWADEIPQMAMATWLIAPYLEKWYFINLPKNSELPFDKKLIITNQKEILKSLKNNTLFKVVKENENSDFYDYDIELNSENIINIYKEVKSLIAPELELTEEETKEYEDWIKEAITKFNSEVKTNIKIDLSNSEFFTFTLTNESKESTLILENTKEEFNIDLNSNSEKAIFTFKWKKSSKWIKWDIILNIEKKEIFKWNSLIEIDWNEYSFEIGWKTEIEWNEVTVSFKISDKTKEKSITIEEPSDASDFQKVVESVMWTMMGGWF